MIPIDRLTDYRGPLETVAQRIPRAKLEAVYGLRLPTPAADQDPDRPPTPQVWPGQEGLVRNHVQVSPVLALGAEPGEGVRERLGVCGVDVEVGVRKDPAWASQGWVTCCCGMAPV